MFNQVVQSLQSPCFASGSNVFRRRDRDLRMLRGRGAAQACREPPCLVRGGFGRCFRQCGRQHPHAGRPSAAAAGTLAVSAKRVVRCVQAVGLGLPSWWKWVHLGAFLAPASKVEGATEGICEKQDMVDKPDHIDTVFLVMVLLVIYGSVTLTVQIYKVVRQSQPAIPAASAAGELPSTIPLSSAAPGLASAAAAAAAVKPQQRTVAVQTEYTFKWWWGAPRLERLREGFWGAWPQ